MLKGIDISHWQGSVNYSAYDFVIMKATEGVDFKDNKKDTHLKNVKKANKLYGFYHYARPEYNANANKEAEYFVNSIKDEIGNCLLALDWEGTALKYPIAWAKQWLDKVYELTGVRPVLYVQESEILRRDYSSIAKANYGLWCAKWSDKEPRTGAWSFWALWQYQGSPLDKDNFNGTKEQFKKYCQSKKVTKPTVNYYPKCSAKETSIVDYLKSIKIDSSLKNRTSIAKKNGIVNYNGNYDQNVYLLELAKQRKLRK